MLFPNWHGTVSLPPHPERRLWIGDNLIVQRPFQGADCKAQAVDCELAGHDLLRLELSEPCREILVRRKRAHHKASDLPVAVTDAPAGVADWPRHVALAWADIGPLASYGDTPEKVLASWVNKFDFRTEDQSTGVTGLRTPQIAALHAISAHFAVGELFEPATVVLPTGTGKTETMLATQVYRRLKKTLVLVPSDALRTQIAEKFVTLGVLSKVGVIPPELLGPRVAVITSGIRNVADAEAIAANANVIVALPSVLQASSPDAVRVLVEACTDLIVDEAHHVTASTWNAVREHFATKRILQFTATPFRRDEKRIDGKIIFNYKLGDAQAADYYRPIDLVTVEEYGDQAARDRAIATKAVAALRADRDERKLDHLLMARTWRQERAEEVLAIYQEIAPDLKPVMVFSGSGRRRANRDALDRVLDRSAEGSRIVVCVDMLGEGFDLPNLKIAALHDNHKSLAITLQFIGRFTRTGARDKIGDATAVTNIADPNAEARLADLYAEGADWDKLIRRLSEERIEKELRLQDIVFGLKERGDLHAHLSLWNLSPPYSAQFFKTTCASWAPLEFRAVLPPKAESWYALNEKENVLVAVVSRSVEVKWGNYQNILNTIHDLVVIQWDRAAGALYLYASDYDGLRSDRMAMAVTDDSTRHISGDPIFNVLNNVELPLVKQLGSSRLGAISFTSYFGPNVTEGLASIEKAESALNNIACLGYENGDRVLWGCTQRRGKVWQHKAGTIAEWIRWTAATWAKVTSEVPAERNITSGFLRPSKLTAPYTSQPISVQWGEQAQMRLSDKQHVSFGATELPLFMVDLEVGDADASGLTIRVVSDAAASEYRLNIAETLTGGYQHTHVSGPPVRFRKGQDAAITLEEYLQRDPFIVRYADGTSSYNCWHIPTNLKAGLFDRDRLEAWDWKGIPLNKESMHKNCDPATIQYRTLEQLRDDYDVIFNDDGCGEAADLICLSETETAVRLCLVHCKGAHEGRVSRDIRNLYTVCGQAQKSVAVKHGGIPRLYLDLRRRHEQWMREGATRFLKGDMRALAYFKEKSRRAKTEFEMVLVQPGVSATTVTDDGLRLLGTTELYLTKTTQAALRVVVSA